MTDRIATAQHKTIPIGVSEVPARAVLRAASIATHTLLNRIQKIRLAVRGKAAED